MAFNNIYKDKTVLITGHAGFSPASHVATVPICVYATIASASIFCAVSAAA